MIWTSRCTREDLLAWLGGQQQVPLGGRLEAAEVRAERSTLTLLWENAPESYRTLPRAILLDSEDVSDFLAWAATYLGGYKPLTALVRVLDERALRSLLELRPVPSLGEVETAWVGGIIGEAVEVLEGRRPIADLSVRACSSGYLFACARAAALWSDPGSAVERVSARWKRAREVARGVPDHAPLAEARELAARGLAARAGGDPLVANLLLAAMSGSLNKAVADVLRDHLAVSSDWTDHLEGPREHRVTLFDRACERFGTRPAGLDPGAGIVLGALLSAIGPGSMEYIRLAEERAAAFPGLVLWYGVFAGANPSSGVLSEFDAFGRKIAKELSYRDAFDERPRCDVSLQELEVLVGGARVPRGWRVANPGTLTVEIEPTIYVTFPWPFAHIAERSARAARDQEPPEPQQLLLAPEVADLDERPPIPEEPGQPPSRSNSSRRRGARERRRRGQ